MDTVVLTDEDGKEHEFAIVDVIEVEGKDYAILLPMGEEADEEEEGDAVILRIDTDEKGEDVLVDIEDDEEWEKVAEAWEAMVDEDDLDFDEDEFDDEDEDLDEDYEEDEDLEDYEEEEEDEDEEAGRKGK
ncbi:MAG: DUF1292 domain-containing protein [Firmicutes bacterium]|nr:DUF1292 domain-containing protein [Bacillota bacterium]